MVLVSTISNFFTKIYPKFLMQINSCSNSALAAKIYCSLLEREMFATSNIELILAFSRAILRHHLVGVKAMFTFTFFVFFQLHFLFRDSLLDINHNFDKTCPYIQFHLLDFYFCKFHHG